MSKYEIYQKELKFLYEAKRVLEKYDINTSSINKRINICLKQLKLLEDLKIC